MAMIAPAQLLPNAIPEMFSQACRSGVLNLADRHGLRVALLLEQLTDEERATVDRLLYSVQRRRITMGTDISTLSD